MRRAAIALALVAAALAPAAASAAAPPWSPPAAVPGSADSFPQFALDPSTGAGLIVATGPRNTILGAPVGVTGNLSRTRTLARGLNLAGFALHTADRVFVVGRPRLVGRSSRLVAAIGRTMGPLRERHVLVRRATLPVAVAGNGLGDLVVVAAACATRRCGRATPVLRIKPRARGLQRTIRLGRSGRVDGAAAAVNFRGDVLAVWTQGGRARARIRAAGGRLGPRQDLGPVAAFPKLSAALGRDRRAIVALGGQAIHEGEPLEPFVPRVAVAPPGGRFGDSLRLERVAASGTGTYVSGPGVAVAYRLGGRAVVAWTGRDGDRFVVRAADVDGATVGTPQTVSPPPAHAVLASLAAGPQGELAIGWLAGVGGADPAPPGTQPALVAAVRPPAAAAFGAPEPVSAGGYVDGAALAVSPVSGAVMAAWRQPGDGIQFSQRTP
jgi:hypothetical protein